MSRSKPGNRKIKTMTCPQEGVGFLTPRRCFDPPSMRPGDKPTENARSTFDRDLKSKSAAPHQPNNLLRNPATPPASLPTTSSLLLFIYVAPNSYALSHCPSIGRCRSSCHHADARQCISPIDRRRRVGGQDDEDGQGPHTRPEVGQAYPQSQSLSPISNSRAFCSFSP